MATALARAKIESDTVVRDGMLLEFLRTAEQRRPQLLRMARRMTQCNEDAEDILQEAFLKAFKALARFRGDSQMSSWLGAIVQNTAREHLRSQKRRVLVSIDCLATKESEAMELDLPDPGKNPEESYAQREVEAVMRAEVSKLSLVCRRAIELCVLADLPQLSVARSLNLSASTMKSRVFRAKRVLTERVVHRLGECREM
jgi:RNA polymerase sigma-70 factor (ECF subfamily)